MLQTLKIEKRVKTKIGRIDCTLLFIFTKKRASLNDVTESDFFDHSLTLANVRPLILFSKIHSPF